MNFIWQVKGLVKIPPILKGSFVSQTRFMHIADS